MNVLIVVSQAVLGGHVISALTIARYLKKNGYHVVFAGGEGRLSKVIKDELQVENVPIPMVHGQVDFTTDEEVSRHGLRATYFTYRSMHAVSRLKKIIQDFEIDVVHAFDARAYIHCSIAALQLKTACCCTLCGGIDPLYNIPNAKKIIVFSGEQRDKMINRYGWKTPHVEVIRTRLDIDKITHDETQPDIKIPLEKNIPVLMMISSFDGTKRESILQVLGALEILIAREIDFQMVFIGGKGAFFEEVKQRALRINSISKRQSIIMTGPVVDAYRLLRNATIVMGVGRSAFEGMAFAKPTIVVGANGFAGLVSPETVDEIGYYNFSGRNQKTLLSADELYQKIENLIEDKDGQRKYGSFARDFVMNEVDVRKGLSRIENVYAENIEGNSSLFRFKQWLSIVRIMIPIWRDNWWHTIGMPLKRVYHTIRS